MNAKALTPEEATAKIATIQQIIMVINAVSKVIFFSNLSLGAMYPFSPLHFFIVWLVIFLKCDIHVAGFCDISDSLFVVEQLLLRMIFRYLTHVYLHSSIKK